MQMLSRSALDGAVVILDLTGRFDAYAIPPIREWLNQVSIRPCPKVIINMTNVNFVDSSALALLMQGLKQCRQNEGDLYLCNFQDAVRTIFELSRLDKAFEVFSNEAEALTAFKMPSQT